MTEWKEYKLGEVLRIKYGKDHKALKDGIYPVYGSGGIMRYAENYLYDKESILIPRKGSLNNIFYQDKAFWTVDTMFWSEIDKTKVFPKFLFYQLTLVDFENLNVGSAVPSLTIPIINEISISLPPLPEQQRIASILSSLDDKIDLLHRENATLEAMAETLFRQWFIEEAKEDWKEVSLEDIAYLSAGGDKPKNVSYNRTNELNIPIYSNGIENEGLYGYTDIPKITEESVTISARGTIGYVVLRTEPFVPIVRLITLTPKKNITSKYLYFWAKSQYINGTGTTQQQLTIPDFKLTKVLLPEKELISEFTNEVDKYYKKILLNKQQIQTLVQTRDGLLPKLMSGEIKI